MWIFNVHSPFILWQLTGQIKSNFKYHEITLSLHTSVFFSLIVVMVMVMMEVSCERVVSSGWSLTGCSIKTEVGSGFPAGWTQTSILSLLTMHFPERPKLWDVHRDVKASKMCERAVPRDDHRTQLQFSFICPDRHRVTSTAQDRIK